jgi:lipid II:glycine glycyltransferase (peptidoglycan interpeptide bridge formation enzyme)
MVDIRQSKEFGRYMESLGWKVERINNINYFIRPFIFGAVSFIKVQRPRRVNPKIITKLAKKYRAWMIVIEPRKSSPRGKPKKQIIPGYRTLKNPYLPSKTLVLDLTKSQKDLLSEMHHKTRYNIKKHKVQMSNIKISNDVAEFAKFWNEQRYGKYSLFSQVRGVEKMYKAFGKNAKTIAAYKNKQLISGILMLIHDKRAYYMYAASNKVGKKNYASTACTWKAIKLAKKLGCKEFDFEGIYDARFPTESWYGFTRFKKSFGGREVSYPASLVRYRLPV